MYRRNARKGGGALSKDQESVYKNYEEMIDDDIARELARINLLFDLYRMVLADGPKQVPFTFRMDHHAQDSNTGVQCANCQSSLSAGLRFI